MRRFLNYYNSAIKRHPNVLLPAFEAVYNGGIQFLLYIMVSNRLGAAALGLWTIVVTISATARIGDIGLQSAISRHVAIAQSQSDRGNTSEIVWSGLALAIAVYSALSLAAWIPLRWTLEVILSREEFRDSVDLLPWTLSIFAVNNISQSAMASLIGLGRIDLRSKYLILGETVQLPLSYVLLGTFGLVGVAIAQLTQFAIALVFSLFFLLRQVGWTRPSVRTGLLLLRFGAAVQLASITQLVFETLFKIALSKQLGMSALGTFELANRFAMQVRNILSAPAQSLITVFTDRDGYNSLFRSTRVYISLSVFIVIFCISASPLIYYFVRSSIDGSIFFQMMLVTSFMWAANVSCIPAYIFGVSVGRLEWNIAGHFISLVLLSVVYLIPSHTFNAVLSTFIIASCRIFGDAVPAIRFILFHKRRIK